MGESTDLLNYFLDEKYSEEDILNWLETGEFKNAPENLQDDHLEAIRQEFPLNLLNYLRDQTKSILTSSQALGQTPLKANQSSKKYDFKSPVKALVDNKNERQKKTRAQSSLESKFNDQPTDLRVKRIEENPEFQNLTKRFSQPKPSLKLNEASNNGDTPKNKNN